MHHAAVVVGLDEQEKLQSRHEICLSGTAVKNRPIRGKSGESSTTALRGRAEKRLSQHITCRRATAQECKRLRDALVRLELPILSPNPGLRQRCVAPDV